jgi:hypothetical protein
MRFHVDVIHRSWERCYHLSKSRDLPNANECPFRTGNRTPTRRHSHTWMPLPRYSAPPPCEMYPAHRSRPECSCDHSVGSAVAQGQPASSRLTSCRLKFTHANADGSSDGPRTLATSVHLIAPAIRGGLRHRRDRRVAPYAGCVVRDNQLAVGCEVHVHFKHIGAALESFLEGRYGVLRRDSRAPTMCYKQWP